MSERRSSCVKALSRFCNFAFTHDGTILNQGWAQFENGRHRADPVFGSAEDYLNREEKLNNSAKLGSAAGVSMWASFGHGVYEPLEGLTVYQDKPSPSLIQIEDYEDHQGDQNDKAQRAREAGFLRCALLLSYQKRWDDGRQK